MSGIHRSFVGGYGNRQLAIIGWSNTLRGAVNKKETIL
jgi:hypothetical protein